MSAADLIYIKKGDTLIPSMGGSTKSETHRLQTTISNSRGAKCRNCRIKSQCPLYKETELDCYCKCPDARGRALFYNMPLYSKAILTKLTIETLHTLRKSCLETKDFKMLHDAALKQMEYLYPPVNKNLNVNVDVKDTATEMVKELKKILEQNAEKKEVIDITPKEENAEQ